MEKDGVAFGYLAMILEAKGSIEEADAAYTKAIDLEFKHWEWRVRRGLMLQEHDPRRARSA